MFGFTVEYPESFQRLIVPEDLAEKDVFNRHCQAILPVPFVPSQCRTILCFDKRCT